MTQPAFDWGAAFNTLRKAAVDLEANVPLPPGPPMTLDEVAATLRSAQPFLAALDGWVKSRPGAIRAMLDILAAMEAQGAPWATELYGVVSQGPGGLAAAEQWLPTVIGALGMFDPASSWHPGPGWARGGVP
ncbi:MAG: hypothetical protein KGL39_54125 [Patescibacteria group bacterium]|nr:hypothetical protein [Patescibacteria group bacterium]